MSKSATLNAPRPRRIRDFDPLVVPGRLVLPGVLAAEDHEVLGGAEGHVQGVVDPAQPEAAGDLGVEAGGRAGLEARDEAGSEAVGVRGPRRRDQRRAVVVVAEDAVEDLLAVLVEVVVAEAGGEVHAVADGQRSLAEQGELLQLVVQVGEEQDVFGRAESHGGNSGQVLEPAHEQLLVVVALVVAVEAAHHPVELVLAAGQAQLLRPDLGVSGVVEGRVERVDVRGQADAAAGDARVRAVASRTTRTSRSVKDVIDVSSAPPKS
jgi:hypothetical protein